MCDDDGRQCAAVGLDNAVVTATLRTAMALHHSGLHEEKQIDYVMTTREARHGPPRSGLAAQPLIWVLPIRFAAIG